MGEVYRLARQFKSKYPMTIAWRIRKNSKVIEEHLNDGETVIYAFVGQKNNNPLDFFSSCVVAITNKRILIGRKRVVFGYFLDSVTPDLFNDLKVLSGVIFGKVYIDTVKEFISISHLDKASLDEVETQISTYMMKKKRNGMNRMDNSTQEKRI